MQINICKTNRLTDIENSYHRGGKKGGLAAGYGIKIQTTMYKVDK